MKLTVLQQAGTRTLRTKENTVSVFAELPHVGEKREKLLLKEFTTIENLAKAQESKIAQVLHVRAQEAGEILLVAKELAAKRTEEKQNKKLILQSRLKGTDFTSNTAESTYAKRLASQALDLEVAEP